MIGIFDKNLYTNLYNFASAKSDLPPLKSLIYNVNSVDWWHPLMPLFKLIL